MTLRIIRSAPIWGSVCLLFTLLFSTATAYAELPDLGDAMSGLVSSQQEYDIGRSWVRSLRRQLPMLDDPQVHDYVRDLIYRLAPNSDLSDRRLEIIVIDSKAFNAFAVPGGIIGVNGGLFLYAQSEQEFASVFAHELSHLAQRHFARRMEEAQKTAPLTMAGMLAGIILAATTGSDAGVATLAASQALSIQHQLAYSRMNEQEADRFGLKTLADSGMDPRAMPTMFERMLKMNRYSQQVPEYFRTHPLTESRVSDTRNRAEQYPVRTYRDDIEFYLMKNRIILHYADSPEAARNLFHSQVSDDGSMFAKAARYGEAIAATQTGAYDEAQQALQPLLQQDPNRATYILAQADLLTARGKLQDSATLLQKLLDRNPDNMAISRDYAAVLLKLGEAKTAEPVLRQLTQQYPDDPEIWRQLADTEGQVGDIVAVHQAQAEYLFLTGDIGAAVMQLQQALKKSEGNYQQTALIQKRLDDFFAAKKGIQF